MGIKQFCFELVGRNLVGGLADVFGLVKGVGIGSQDIVLRGVFCRIGAAEACDSKHHGEYGYQQGGTRFKGVARLVGCVCGFC